MMRVIECCPFYNENDLLEIKVNEGKSWIDEFRISESSHTFKYKEKGYNLSTSSDKVVHLKIDGHNLFKEKYLGLSRSLPFIRMKAGAWKNEAFQRNFATLDIHPNDDDIIILSDIDEIIDSRHAEYLIGLAKQHEVISVKLHFTMFYMNLFSLNWHEVWPGSPKDYGFRTFLMSGRYFNNLKYSSDKLRHLGEASKLVKTIFCPEEFMGFHHSWLGDEDAIYQKLMSYAHDIGDHGSEVQSAFEAGNIKEYISSKLAKNESIFPGHKLLKKNFGDVKWLNSISNNMDSYEKYFIN
jgi:hypothetical protein